MWMMEPANSRIAVEEEKSETSDRFSKGGGSEAGRLSQVHNSRSRPNGRDSVFCSVQLHWAPMRDGPWPRAVRCGVVVLTRGTGCVGGDDD